MSLEKDIQNMTAAINNLAEALREGRVTVTGPVAVVFRNDVELGAHNDDSAKLPPPPFVVGGEAQPEPEPEPEAAAPLTFEDVKAAFLGIAKAVGDPVKGAERSKAVLARYGAAKMKDVEEAKWPAFVEDCRAAAAVAQ